GGRKSLPTQVFAHRSTRIQRRSRAVLVRSISLHVMTGSTTVHFWAILACFDPLQRTHILTAPGPRPFRTRFCFSSIATTRISRDFERFEHESALGNPRVSGACVRGGFGGQEVASLGAVASCTLVSLSHVPDDHL